jgi:hypothetical protein
MNGIVTYSGGPWVNTTLGGTAPYGIGMGSPSPMPRSPLSGTMNSQGGGAILRQPDWMGPLSKGLTLASGILSGINSFGVAQQYRGNANQLKIRAGQALEQGFQSGIDLSREGAEVLGSMSTAFGKSGTLMEGSPLLVMADTISRINQNVSRTIQQARLERVALLAEARRMERASRSSVLGGIGQIAGAALSIVPGLQPVGLAVLAGQSFAK